MKTKLTLTIDKDIIEKSKNYAARQNLSLSNFLEKFLRKELMGKEKSFTDKWNPVFQKIRGKLDYNLKAMRCDHINKKHTG